MNTNNANKYLDSLQIADRSVWDKTSIEHPLDCLLEDCHQEQLKNIEGLTVISSSNEFTRHSNCCNEEVKVIGQVTNHYQCNHCKQPCDTEMLEDEKG